MARVSRPTLAKAERGERISPASAQRISALYGLDVIELIGSVSRIREARVRAGLSQEELAQRAGCSQPMVAQIERGDRAPSESLERALCVALGLDT